MPTFVHKDTGKKVFFAHIPRTAGRFVEANLWQMDLSGERVTWTLVLVSCL